MEKIRATLPTLGDVDIAFYKESLEVLDFFGKAERARLDSVPHLGPAARAFTGLNHSRWEYTLLQCALIQYVAVIFRHDPEFALANRVELDGAGPTISSGEELLKSWAILGNAGHTQWTYGVERGLLRVAQIDMDVRRWLIHSTRLSDLKQWIEECLESYDDSSMHYILILRRIAYGDPYDRRKTKFAHMIRNLVLPLPSLHVHNAVARTKISRLRRMYDRIRLLSLVTLDAYYSHNPLRISLHTTINSFAQLAGVGRGLSQFRDLLTDAASWLADQLYLHPDATAIQREYERRVQAKFIPRYRKATRSKRSLSHLLANVFSNGLGDPWVGRYTPILRLSFTGQGQRLLGGHNLFAAEESLVNRLCVPPESDLCLSRNPYSDLVHLDLFYRQSEDPLRVQIQSWLRTSRWLLRSIEADALRTYKRMVPARLRSEATIPIRERVVRNALLRHRDKFETLFWSVIQGILPVGWSAMASIPLDSEDYGDALGYRISSPSGCEVDQLDRHLSEQLDRNPHNHHSDRLHEMGGLQQLARAARASVVIACCQPIAIHDSFGRERDDWDGTLLEVDLDSNELRLCVLEAKSGGGALQRTNQAFDQLAATRDIVCRDERVRFRRRRIRGVGATLTLRLAAV